MADDWVPRVNAVIDAVREDLSEPHTLDSLAERAIASPHHFHRRFHELTGETPAQFVRRSRLERAAYLMMANPDASLAEVCFESGFSDQSVFSRVFRSNYGCAPSAWRTETQSRSSIFSSADEAARVRVVTRPAMRLAMIRVRGVFGIDDLREGYRTLVAWMHDRGLDPARASLVGASFDNYETTPLDRVHYSFGFTIPAELDGSSGIHVRTLPAFTAAAVSIDGGLPDIATAWDTLYHHWFPARPWSPAALPAMKLFRRLPEEGEWRHFDLDCAIAFRQAQS